MPLLAQDLRQAFRVLIKSPGFSLVAIGALALGIGANTAIFSIINRVLLEPLPYREPDRIVRLMRGFPGGTGASVSIPKFTVWKRQNRVFEYMAAYDFSGPGLNLSGGDTPEQIKGIHVSSEFFPLFGAVPVVGRTFTGEEDRPGGPRVAVLSYGLWKRRWGADRGLIGRSIVLNSEPSTVIGVLPEGFHSDPPAEIWIPLQADPNSTNQGHYLFAAARLKAGVSLESAQSQMKLVGEEFRRAYPRWMGSKEFVAVVPFQEAMVRNVRPALLILSGAVILVLLIACANVANLLLARAATRTREVAVRTALGAGRWDVVRQLLTESLLLAVCGGALGLLLGSWGVRALLAASPGDIPRVTEFAHAGWAALLDLRVFAFGLLVSLATGLLFGLAPALEISKPDLASTLKESGSRSSTGRQMRARGALVISEVALALVLVIGSALLIRTFLSLRSVNPGFDIHHVLTVQTSLSGGRYDSTASVERLTTRILERIESLPGVVAASSSTNVPLEDGPDLPFTIEGRPLADNNPYHGDVQWRYAGPDYFRALKAALLRGRFFNRQDTAQSAPVVIINDAMARRYWSGYPQREDPIGKRITIGGGLGPEFADAPREIVGIVGDIRENGLEQLPPPVMYVPYGQVPDGTTRLANRIVPVSWIIRTTPDPRSLVSAIQQEFLAVDRQLPVARVRTMEQVVSGATARQNFNMLLLGVFAVIAVLLAALGIYGIISYSIEQRTREMGIRMALGAGAGDLLRMVVAQGLRLTAAGVGIGLAASFGLTRLLGSLLFGVKPTDPGTFAEVAGMLFAVALLAAYIPARRATRVDPVIALRYE